MMGLGIVVPALLSLLTPLAALSSSIAPVVVLRVLEGVFQGFVFPSQGAILGKWSPPLERSRWNAVCNAGSYIGAIVTFPLTGFLCQCGYAGGWPSAFYTFGIAGVVWYMLWLFLAYETPSSHPRISQKELKYIQTALQSEKKEVVSSVPWLSMFTSWPFWAIFVAFMCNDWGFYILLTCLPTFLKDTLPDGVDITKDGLLAGIPYVSMAVVALVWSYVTDFAISRGLSVVVARKLNTGVGMTLPAVFLIICGYVGNSVTVAVVLISLALGGEGFNVAGFATSALDIAPRYAGIIVGIANSASSATGIVAPHIVKLITTADSVDLLREQWREVFIIAAEVFLFGGIIFALLASGEVQPWAVKKDPLPKRVEILNVNVKEDDREVLVLTIDDDFVGKAS
jgi:ACS family sodium-dependent inorganic phosphate cotransporter-like MFS transporter 5